MQHRDDVFSILSPDEDSLAMPQSDRSDLSPVLAYVPDLLEPLPFEQLLQSEYTNPYGDTISQTQQTEYTMAASCPVMTNTKKRCHPEEQAEQAGRTAKMTKFKTPDELKKLEKLVRYIGAGRFSGATIETKINDLLSRINNSRTVLDFASALGFSSSNMITRPFKRAGLYFLEIKLNKTYDEICEIICSDQYDDHNQFANDFKVACGCVKEYLFAHNKATYSRLRMDKMTVAKFLTEIRKLVLEDKNRHLYIKHITEKFHTSNYTLEAFLIDIFGFKEYWKLSDPLRKINDEGFNSLCAQYTMPCNELKDKRTNLLGDLAKPVVKKSSPNSTGIIHSVIGVTTLPISTPGLPENPSTVSVDTLVGTPLPSALERLPDNKEFLGVKP